MKKLETVWALKHKGVVDTMYESREYLDKIFQLKLSLPTKISFPKEEDEQEVNKLIEDYLQSLTQNKEIPLDLKGIIVTAFPPNPRKIKRALTLAYFIGKNIKKDIDDSEFKEIFSYVLIWSVCCLYFSELAKLIKEIPYVLPDLCLVVANTRDIGNLRLKLDNLERKLES